MAIGAVRNVAALLALLAGCGQETQPASPPVPVRVVEVAPHAAGGGLRYSASVIPHTQLDLAFDAEGYVTEIGQRPAVDGGTRDLQQGDAVEKDAPLARIEDEQYVDRLEEARARLAEAEAALRKAKADFDRDAKLYASKSITAPEYDRARKDYESTQAEVAGAGARVDQAEERLASCTLRAPMAGVILERDIEVGSLVRSGTRAFQLGDVSSVKVVFGVPDVGLGDLELGSPLSFSTASAPGRRFKGRISAIAPSADGNTRVFEIEISVPNPDGALKPGMIASLDLGAARSAAPVVAVPVGAVLRSPRDAKGYAVAVVASESGGSVARIRDVELSEPVGDEVIVTRGLQAGERVIVSGARLVSDGAAVRIVP